MWARNPTLNFRSVTCAFVTSLEVESRCCFSGLTLSEPMSEPRLEDEAAVVHISSSTAAKSPLGSKRLRSQSVLEDGQFVEYVVHMCHWGVSPGAHRGRVIRSFWFEEGSPCTALYQAVQLWCGIQLEHQRVALFTFSHNSRDEFIPVVEQVLSPHGCLPRRPSQGPCMVWGNEIGNLEVSQAPSLFQSTLEFRGPYLRYVSICAVVTAFGKMQFATPSFVAAFPAGNHVDPSELVRVAAATLSRGSVPLQQYLQRLHLISIQVHRVSGDIGFTEAPPIFISDAATSRFERKQARQNGTALQPVLPEALIGTVADYGHHATQRSEGNQLDRVALVLSHFNGSVCSLHSGKEPCPAVTRGLGRSEDTCFAKTSAVSLDGHHVFPSVWISDVQPV